MVQLLDGCGRMLLAWGRKVEVEEGGEGEEVGEMGRKKMVGSGAAKATEWPSAIEAVHLMCLWRHPLPSREDPHTLVGSKAVTSNLSRRNQLVGGGLRASRRLP